MPQKAHVLYPRKEFKGVIEAENIIIGNVRKPVFTAAELKFDDFFWSHNEQKLSTQYLLVDEPEFSWNRSGNRDNPLSPVSVFLRHIFLPEPDGTSQDPDRSTAHFSLNIGRIDFSDGAGSYQDLRISPPVAVGITGINGSIDKLEYPIAKEQSGIKMTGHIEGRPFTIEGEGKLMQDPPSADFVFSSPSLPLSLFTRQLEKKTRNLDFAKGLIAINSSYSIRGAEQQHNTSLSLEGIMPGKGSTPESTALALMNNASGKISLQIEAHGDDAYEPLISKTVSTINTSIIKASINPMLLAGDRFDDLVSNQFIPFVPGTATISGEGIERMSRFSEFLALYPMTKLVLSGYADRNDAEILKKQLLSQEQQKLDEINKKRLAEWQKKKKEEEERLLQQEAAARSGQIQESDILRPRLEPFVPLTPKTVNVTDAMLAELAMKREQTALDHFISHLSVPAGRLAIKQQKSNRIVEGQHSGRVEIELSDLY